ncbi:hypothetical protein [Arthrobacter terrae]|uniref:hypothetical protein n=1 Tax=Arthrobacter terrae TaxID=2935737 RepID=UPI0035E40889
MGIPAGGSGAAANGAVEGNGADLGAAARGPGSAEPRRARSLVPRRDLRRRRDDDQCPEPGRGNGTIADVGDGNLTILHPGRRSGGYRTAGIHRSPAASRDIAGRTTGAGRARGAGWGPHLDPVCDACTAVADNPDNRGTEADNPANRGTEADNPANRGTEADNPANRGTEADNPANRGTEADNAVAFSNAVASANPVANPVANPISFSVAVAFSNASANPISFSVAVPFSVAKPHAQPSAKDRSTAGGSSRFGP